MSSGLPIGVENLIVKSILFGAREPEVGHSVLLHSVLQHLLCLFFLLSICKMGIIVLTYGVVVKVNETRHVEHWRPCSMQTSKYYREV